jgi:hypothetical protein
MRLLRLIATFTPILALVPLIAAAQTPRYEQIEVANGGAVRGRVTFEGAPPAFKLKVTQDLTVCHHEDGLTSSTRLSVGPEGGVAEAVVFLRDVARGKPLAELEAPLKLDQVGCAYKPFVQVAPFLSSLEIVNSDRLNHNVNGKTDDGMQVFNYAMPNPNWPEKQSIARPMRRAGLLTIQCDIHNWMSAYVWVVRHPYYAVTDAKGAFELKDVPPGEYELVAWHPGWKVEPRTTALGQPAGYDYGAPVEKSVKVTVAPGGAATVDFVINK